MSSGGNNINYFHQNQLIQFSTCSLNNKAKQGQPNKFIVEEQIICERSQQKKNGAVIRRNVVFCVMRF